MTANDLLGSVLVYLGLFGAAVGTFAVLRPVHWLRLSTRRRGALLLGTGLVFVLLGMAIPAPLRHAMGSTRLDEILPDYQFSEFHETEVEATPAVIHRAIWQVTAREIRLFGLFTWIRSPHWPGRRKDETILSAPADRPILEVATSSGFRRLADEENEVVVGAAVITPRGLRPTGDLRKIPGLALAVMSFRTEPLGADRCRLTTETRIFATDRSTFRRFKRYWRLIAPGSAILRSTWLQAIRARAEREPADR
ncbi:MAG TPA: hypothetical protein VGS22_11915 [Thermoanaerobaculia bacterium]|jgi:hypothetical protein|nr:hypothetical protein [Thermoanaerobaculia bacterium]